MENQLVSRFVKGLGLKRHVVGVNFLAYREEFEKYDAPAATIRRSICGFANMAMNGECVKFRAEDVGCSGGSYAVGLREEPNEQNLVVFMSTVVCIVHTQQQEMSTKA